VEELGQLFGARELVHVEERLVRGSALIVLQPCTHHNWQNIVPAIKQHHEKIGYLNGYYMSQAFLL